MKVIVVKRKDAFPAAKRKVSDMNSLEKERVAIRKLTTKRESHSYREAVAAKVPVTYVSDGKIVRETEGERIVIGRTAPRVKIVVKE